MDNKAKLSNKGKSGSGKTGKTKGAKAGRGKVNTGKKVRLQESVEAMVELHKLEFVLLNQMQKEIK